MSAKALIGFNEKRAFFFFECHFFECFVFGWGSIIPIEKLKNEEGHVIEMKQAKETKNTI